MSNNSIGKVTLDLETNYGPFQQQLGNISGKSTNMVTAAFGKMGKAFAGAFAVTKLVQFGKASIDLASDLQEVQNVVDVVFGKSAEQINNFAKNALEAYGLSELSAKKYASTMGAMLKSMGLSEQATLNMSQSITALAGDMASFYNLNGDDAFNKIRSGISGETEPLKQLGINMSQANLEAFALSQGISKSVKSMTQSEQALLRYNYLLSVTADAQGDFSRTSDGWANQTRILTERFNSLKATLGSAFMSVLAPVVKGLNWLISKLQIAANYFKAFVEAITGKKSETSNAASGMTDIADSATEAGEATEKAAKKASKALAGFDKLNVLSSGGGDSGSGGSSGGGISGLEVPDFSAVDMTLPKPDTSGVEEAMGKVKRLYQNLGKYVIQNFAPTIKSWGGAFKDLKEPAKKALGEMGTSLSTLWNEKFVPFGKYIAEDWVPSVVNTFSETFAPIFRDSMPYVIDEFSKDFDFMCQQMGKSLEDFVFPVLELLKTIFTDVCGTIRDEWDKSGIHLLETFSDFKDSFRETWNNLYDNILKPVWDGIVNALSDIWDESLKPLWDKLVPFFSKLGEFIMVLWNNFLGPIVNYIVKIVGPVITEVLGAIWDVVKKVFNAISDVIGGVLDALGGLLDFLIGVFTGDWNRAWTGIKNFFKGIWDAIVGIVKGAINILISIVNALWTAIYSVVSAIVNAIGDLVGWIGGLFGADWGWEMNTKAPKIPYLARGGIIDQPTLAMVGEKGKEAVVPLENTAFADSIANAILKVLTPLFAGGSTVGKNDDGSTVIVLKVGEYELGRVTVGAINKYHNVVGKVELEV